MTSVIMRDILNKQPDATFNVLADPNDLADYGINATIKGAKGIGFWRKIPFFRKLMMRYVYTPAFATNQHLIIFGGGSIFQHHAVMQRQLQVIQVAKRSNPKIKLVAIGVSVGPFKQAADKETATKLLKQMDFIGLRDHASKIEFDKLGLTTQHIVAPDIALLLPKLANLAAPQPQADRKDYIGVSLRHGRTSEDILMHIAKILSYVLQEHASYKVKFFQFCALPHENDLDLLPALLEKIPSEYQHRIEIVAYSRNPLDTYAAIQDCKLMLSVRLHAAVLSYAMKTPFLVYPYHTKCTDFAKMVGSPDTYTAQPTEAINISQIERMLAGYATDQFTDYQKVITASAQHLTGI